MKTLWVRVPHVNLLAISQQSKNNKELVHGRHTTALEDDQAHDWLTHLVMHCVNQLRQLSVKVEVYREVKITLCNKTQN